MEVMVAIFILVVAIASVLFMFSLSTQIMYSSKMASGGTFLAQGKMEDINLLSYQEILVGDTTEASLPAPFASFSRETRIRYVDPDQNLQETTIDKGLKKVEVTVSWNGLFTISSQNVKLKTIISER